MIASLDMHWIGRFLVNANRRPNAQGLSVQCRKLAAVDALVLAERNPDEERSFETGEVPTG